MPANIVSLNRSNGGVPKTSVNEAAVSSEGMQGDHQSDRRHHGGPDRALSLYSLELIDQLALDGHPITAGSVGENVTIGGLDWSRMQPGTRLRLGDVEIELTAFAAPCRTIRNSFLDEEFTRISEKLYPGWSRLYARIIRDGVLHAGDPVEVL